ncbi:MAG: hypothetical protein L0Z50_30235, partial [Verrucomicrobiales bacterium]|nr:hypothetical protein [Verrucomicrobiales bacterium]
MKLFSKLPALVLTIGLGFQYAHAQNCQPSAEDRDGDCIADAIEYHLLQRFAPILYRNDNADEPREGIGVPVSISWLLRNSKLIGRSDGGLFVEIRDRPSMASAMSFINANGGGEGFKISNYHINGDAPGDEKRTWPISTTLGEGVYGRVWKPWPAGGPYPHPHIYSI